MQSRTLSFKFMAQYIPAVTMTEGASPCLSPNTPAPLSMCSTTIGQIPITEPESKYPFSGLVDLDLADFSYTRCDMFTVITSSLRRSETTRLYWLPAKKPQSQLWSSHVYTYCFTQL